MGKRGVFEKVLGEIDKSFDKYKNKSDKVIAAEEKSNPRRAKELRRVIDRISRDLTKHQKKMATLERALFRHQGATDTPAYRKARREHLKLFRGWLARHGANAICTPPGEFKNPSAISRDIDRLIIKHKARKP